MVWTRCAIVSACVSVAWSASPMRREELLAVDADGTITKHAPSALIHASGSLQQKNHDTREEQMAAQVAAMTPEEQVAYMVQMFGPGAVDGFINLHDVAVHEYCAPENNMTNLASKVWWPGCHFTQGSSCGMPCFSDSWLQDIIDFNEQHDRPGQIVRYNNRPGAGEQDKDVQMVELGGWLLPAANRSNSLGRIVVQHGFTSNSNKFRQLAMGVMFRQLGFDVLMSNFRDHCYSDDSKARVTEWGHAYPYDLLGAVDYMRNDPDNKLGGPVEASKVGIMGISMGAFTAVNAFGMDGEVPGVWVDSPPSSPKNAFESAGRPGMFAAQIPAFLHGPLHEGLWAFVYEKALEKGIDLNEHLPKDVLRTGPPTKRPFAIVGNIQDTTVPIEECFIIRDIAIEHPEKYDTEMWQADSTCMDSKHCVDHIKHWDEYKARSCLFWYKVFGIDKKDCPALPTDLAMTKNPPTTR